MDSNEDGKLSELSRFWVTRLFQASMSQTNVTGRAVTIYNIIHYSLIHYSLSYLIHNSMGEFIIQMDLICKYQLSLNGNWAEL